MLISATCGLAKRVLSHREFIQVWLNNKTKATQSAYIFTVKQFIEFIDKPLADVTLEDLQLWQQGLKLRYKIVTVEKKTITIKSLFSFAYEVEYISTNPGKFLKIPKIKNTLAERILDTDSVGLLLKAPSYQSYHGDWLQERGAAALASRDRLILSLMYSCGLRVSEVINLTWADLKPHRRGGKITVFGKGGKTRILVVPPKLWQALCGWQKQSGEDYVFVSRRKKKLDRSAVHRLIKKACKQAGIDEKTSAHWLRHSHASHALEQGCNVRLLQQSLGHSSVSTTEKYLHVSPERAAPQLR